MSSDIVVVELPVLPADVLVAVMQFLPVKDVLACRLVCKELADLALCGDVWRHRQLAGDHSRASAVLRLAPRLDEVFVHRRTLLAMTTTKCAVSKLTLLADLSWFYCSARHDARFPLYAEAVRNQEALGRLRQLTLRSDMRLMNQKKIKADVLVSALATCSGLKKLTIDTVELQTDKPVTAGPIRPSLEFFRCRATDDNSVSFVNTMLAGHGATLEEVDIISSGPLWFKKPVDWADASPAHLLAAMPNLRTLRCDMTMPGLEAVAACTTLRALWLGACESEWGDGVAAIEGASELLRRADQLREVGLDRRCEAFSLSPDVGRTLLEALASSGKSQVERLSLVAFLDVRPLLSALPSLPALRTLAVVNTDFLEELMEFPPEGIPCIHSWIHSDEVKAALLSNPSLHILLQGRYDCDQEDCESCQRYCHQEIKLLRHVGTGVQICLFSHEIGKCPSSKRHSEWLSWVIEITHDSLCDPEDNDVAIIQGGIGGL
ncbi:uncharacterized protein LOC113211025 [Frankliniella occidentalis]|uniref:Uncharacterized protein LOC113211025 n=1 Tax=Frankliniella occidentalis TaxID=133901 RepID=A0A6J1T0B8_FRAOC|nr:uncharacterized protein LOC113211025 [Frankliniella occidentalis]